MWVFDLDALEVENSTRQLAGYILAESRPGEDAEPPRLARFMPMDHKNDRNINAAINDPFSAGRASRRLGRRETVASSSELRVGF